MKKLNKGFTLVELLVVMAIISILAAIAVPNVQKYISRGRATQATSEIQNIELAITAMLSDAGRSNILDLFDVDEMGTLVTPNVNINRPDTWAIGDFENLTELFTDRMYRLMKRGRGAATDPDNPSNSIPGYNEDAIRNLGSSYFAELDRDPWGNLYQFYPGPWRAANGPNVFRIYLPPTATDVVPGESSGAIDGDDLSLGTASPSAIELLDLDNGDPIPLAGVPAPNQVSAYVWSYGANLVSGQARFRPPLAGYRPGDATNQYTGMNPINDGLYDTGQEPELMGGGDDINNWDKSQSFMRFY